jgi:hypothetical protein
MSLPKINAFVVKGPTNTGKSLLLFIPLEDTQPTGISREKDKFNFHLDQLPNSTSVIFEEPIIDQTPVGTWKLLFEGSPVPTDMEHTDKELIERLPIFISTNHNIWNWVTLMRFLHYDKDYFNLKRWQQYDLHLRQLSQYFNHLPY